MSAGPLRGYSPARRDIMRPSLNSYLMEVGDIDFWRHNPLFSWVARSRDDATPCSAGACAHARGANILHVRAEVALVSFGGKWRGVHGLGFWSFGNGRRLGIHLAWRSPRSAFHFITMRKTAKKLRGRRARQLHAKTASERISRKSVLVQCICRLIYMYSN